MPNTSRVRVLLVSLYPDDSHGLKERAILGWRTEAQVPGGDDTIHVTPIIPDYLVISNVEWCYFEGDEYGTMISP